MDAVAVRAPEHRAGWDEDALAVPADTGCDWQRLDPRFGRCVTCPLPRCRYEYPQPDQRRAAQAIQVLEGQRRSQLGPRPPRSRQRKRPGVPASAAAAAVIPERVLVHIAEQVLVRGRSHQKREPSCSERRENIQAGTRGR